MEEPASNAEELLLVGRIGRPHGVRGEVKVVPETDDPARIEALGTLHVGADAERARPQAVEHVRMQHTRRGPLALVKFAGVDAREAAEALRGLLVFARPADLPPLAEGEAFVHDLVGLRVVSEEGEDVGTVKDVLQAPAHALYVVDRPGGPDALIPAVGAFVSSVDLEAGRLVIRPIEGLL